MIWVFYGGDSHSISRALAAIREDGAFEDIDVMRLNVAVAPLGEILMAVGTGGLFAPRRLVLLHGLADQAARPRKNQAKGADEDPQLTPDALAAGTASGTTVVVLAIGLSKDSAFIKRSREMAVSSEAIRVQEMATPDARDMAGWIVRQARDEGAKIEPAAAALLAARVGADVGLAGSELEKLSVAAGADASITVNLVEELVPATVEESIFPLIDAIASGKREDALRGADRQLRQLAGNETELMLRLVRLLARQFRILLQIRLLQRAGKKQDEIVAELKLPRYYAGKYFAQAKRLSGRQLFSALEQLAASEEAVKNGEEGDAALPLLLAGLTDLASASRKATAGAA